MNKRYLDGVPFVGSDPLQVQGVIDEVARALERAKFVITHSTLFFVLDGEGHSPQLPPHRTLSFGSSGNRPNLVAVGIEALPLCAPPAPVGQDQLVWWPTESWEGNFW